MRYEDYQGLNLTSLPLLLGRYMMVLCLSFIIWKISSFLCSPQALTELLRGLNNIKHLEHCPMLEHFSKHSVHATLEKVFLT